MSALTEYLDCMCGLGYRIKFKTQFGGFFNVTTSRKDFNGNKIKTKQTLGKDGFSDEKLIQLIGWQTTELQKMFNNQKQ